MMTTSTTTNWQTLKLSREVRRMAQPKQRFRQFVRPESGFGIHMGDTLDFTKVPRLPQNGRMIGELDDIPNADLTILRDQIKAEEHSMQVQFTGRASMLSELSLEHTIIRELTDNAAIYLDKEAAKEFRKGDLVYTPTGTVSSKTYTLTTNGTPGAVASRPVAAYDIQVISDLMRGTYNIPGFRGTNMYVCISSVNGTRGIKNDADWISPTQYANPERILSGEVGEYQQFRFLEENNVLTNVITGGGGEMIFFGDDAVMELEIIPLQLQNALADSYGRFKGLRWMWYGGFKKIWSFSTDGAARILRVASL